MSSLIISVAGKSSRFPNVRPKWLLTHPSSRTMLIESIMGLNYPRYENIYIIVSREHQDRYQPDFKAMFDEIGQKPIIFVLEEPTKSLAEAISLLIKEKDITGSITIKDCDNYFKMPLQEGNFVATYNLNNKDSIIPGNKSYVTVLENLGIITNIVEKRVISDTFCCGAYGFEHAETFVEYYEKLNGKIGSELYISHIIYDMILNGYSFRNVPTENYIDWGELEDWLKFTSQYSTLFVDLDGVLIQAGNEFCLPFQGNTEPLQNNIDYINNLFNSGYHCIILTTARRNKHELQIELSDKDIKYHELITGIPHAKRIIINDFATTNPYPSCEAINLPRNNDTLKDLL